MASGFSAWGITNGTAAAALLVDQLGGRSNQFSALLDPRRPGLAALGELVKHNATVARHFVAGHLRSDPAGASSGLKPADAAVMKIGGKAAALLTATKKEKCLRYQPPAHPWLHSGMERVGILMGLPLSRLSLRRQR